MKPLIEQKDLLAHKRALKQRERFAEEFAMAVRDRRNGVIFRLEAKALEEERLRKTKFKKNPKYPHKRSDGTDFKRADKHLKKVLGDHTHE